MFTFCFDQASAESDINILNLTLQDQIFRLFYLTEVAGEGGPDLAPQTFLSSQKFRHLMG